METPKGKNSPKLPPKGPGGGAAARQKQFEKERGLRREEEPDTEQPTEADAKPKRKQQT